VGGRCFCRRVCGVGRRGILKADEVQIIGAAKEDGLSPLSSHPAQPAAPAPPHGAHSHSHAHASYREIQAAIDSAEISPGAKNFAQAAYRAIAKAEAAVHGMTLDDVRFHEVGSARTIYAIAGAAIAADILTGKFGVTAFTCGTLTDGSGTIVCSHGTIPVPVPAVRELLKQTDIPLLSDPQIKTELVTPSGLGLLIGLGCRATQAPTTQEAAQAPTAQGAAQAPTTQGAAQATTTTQGALQTLGSFQRVGYGFGTRDTGLLGAIRATLY
jgi:uncharacterized protein (DUF111 family)